MPVITIINYMRIVFIGSGNTATVLGKLLKTAGHNIIGVYSKTHEHARALAVELNAQYVGDITTINKDAELYIIAVNDDMITTVANSLRLAGKTVVHTSGSVPATALKDISSEYGVLYPLQSLRRQAAHQPVIPFLIDGSTTTVKEQVRQLAQSISTIVEEADDDKRLKLHLAAVIVSNFTNHLYTLAEDFCLKEAIPFKALVPLIQEVAYRTAAYSPTAMQTGPAARGDMATIEKHIELLNSYPLLQKMYKGTTESILAFKEKL